MFARNRQQQLCNIKGAGIIRPLFLERVAMSSPFSASKLVIANWKMHGSLAQVRTALSVLSQEPACNQSHIMIALPAPYLLLANEWQQQQQASWQIAAQDVSIFAEDGAFTGEVSARMLADVGCAAVLVGHSERRQYFAEGQLVLSKKLKALAQHNLLPVFCVGESFAQREAGLAWQTVEQQLDEVLPLLKELLHVVVAYEPVWAIGTGKVASLADVEDMHAQLQKKLLHSLPACATMRVLYGGSVKADNAEAILALPQVDGVLVGGASLDLGQFKKICQASEKR